MAGQVGLDEVARAAGVAAFAAAAAAGTSAPELLADAVDGAMRWWLRARPAFEEVKDATERPQAHVRAEEPAAPVAAHRQLKLQLSDTSTADSFCIGDTCDVAAQTHDTIPPLDLSVLISAGPVGAAGVEALDGGHPCVQADEGHDPVRAGRSQQQLKQNLLNLGGESKRKEGHDAAVAEATAARSVQPCGSLEPETTRPQGHEWAGGDGSRLPMASSRPPGNECYQESLRKEKVGSSSSSGEGGSEINDDSYHCDVGNAGTGSAETAGVPDGAQDPVIEEGLLDGGGVQREISDDCYQCGGGNVDKGSAETTDGPVITEGMLDGGGVQQGILGVLVKLKLPPMLEGGPERFAEVKIDTGDADHFRERMQRKQHLWEFFMGRRSKKQDKLHQAELRELRSYMLGKWPEVEWEAELA